MGFELAGLRLRILPVSAGLNEYFFVGSFLVVNGVLIYLFTRNFLLLPFPILAALAVELVWKGKQDPRFQRRVADGRRR